VNNTWVKYGSYFILIVLLQGLVINNIEASVYLNPMIYPVMILMLPFELNTIITLFVSLILGLSVDAFSNTFGLHASAAVLVGYLRPITLNILKPRDGYDNTLLPSIHDMGKLWFLIYASVLIFIHHLWFFAIEVFNFELAFLILFQALASTGFSVALIILFQYIFYKSSR
jgi:hypothetical protein